MLCLGTCTLERFPLLVPSQMLALSELPALECMTFRTYSCITHRHHYPMSSTVQCPLDHPRSCGRYPDYWRATCGRDGPDLKIHFAVIDVSVFTVDENPLTFNSTVITMAACDTFVHNIASKSNAGVGTYVWPQ